MTGNTPMTFVSYATEYDLYSGDRNWQELSRDERRRIVMQMIGDLPPDTSWADTVMATGLRKRQAEGLHSVVITLAQAHEKISGDGFSMHDADRSPVLPYLAGTALGAELEALWTGRGAAETSYRAGELEFLASDGNRPSPLFDLLSLPGDLISQGVCELLQKPAVSEFSPKTTANCAAMIAGKPAPRRRLGLLLKPHEVQSVCAELDRFFSGSDYLASDLVHGEAIRLAKRDPGILDMIRKQGKSPLHVAMLLVCNLCYRHVASGTHHVYRKLLSDIGQSCFSIYQDALTVSVDRGFVTADEASKELEALVDELQGVG